MVITNQMLQVSSDCYYISVKESRKIGDWHGAYLDKNNSVKIGIQIIPLLINKSK